MCDGETSASKKCAMAKHPLRDNEVSWKRGRNIDKTYDKNITPNNDIKNQSRITSMCDGETSASNKCAKEKHRLKGNKISWKRWRNINKTDDKTSHLTMILSIKVG